MMPIYKSLTDSFLISFSEPKTNLTAPPAFTVTADRMLAAYMEAEITPHAVLMYVKESLSVVSPDGAWHETLYTCMQMICGKAYPIFYVSEEAVGRELIAFCDENNLGDITLCVPWEKRALLPMLRRELPLSRGMLDLRGQTLPTDLMTLPGECCRHDATQLMLDRPLLRAENRALQKFFIGVWVDSDEASLADAVCSGACGIVTDTPAALLGLLARFPAAATVRPMPLYAHKGFHMTGETPENSLLGVTEAGRRGYDAAEIDVQPSRDGVLLLHHDYTSANLFDGDLRICGTDYAELAALRRKAFPDVGLDRFADVLCAMSAYPETPIMLEFKPPAHTYGLEHCVRETAALMAREDTQKHFVAIMGQIPPYLDYVHKHLPTLPLAHCIMGLDKEPPKDMREANLQISRLAFDTRGANAGVNPYHEKANDLLGRCAHWRGITIFIWTWAFKPWETDGASICQSFCSCYDGITSDWVHMLADCPVDVILDGQNTYQAGTACLLSGTRVLRGGRRETVAGIGVIPLDDGICTVENGCVSAAAGEYTVIPYDTYTMPDSTAICICGMPTQLRFE